MRLPKFPATQRFSVQVAFLLATCVAVMGFKEPAGEPSTSYVQVEANLSHETMRPGQTGSVLVSFVPADDIHINADPAVDINIPPTRIYAPVGKTKQVIDTSTGYLSTADQVVRRFIVSKQARQGTYLVKSAVVYYYCSNSEGWCRKKVEPVELRLTIIR